MTDHEYDVVVVGVGGMGSAALAHLAQRGARVLGLEGYDIPHAMGSSHGVTRIIRKAYHEHPDYVPLLNRSYELWRDLDRSHDRQLLHVHGSLTAGPKGADVVEGAKQACEDHDLAADILGAGEVNQRFPGFGLPEDHEAVFQPDGGFLWSDQCVVAHVEAAHRAGGTIRARERVTDWSETANGVRIETDRDSYTAGKLVFAAGAWTAKLLPSFEEFLTPQRQVLGWFHPTVPEQYRPESFPVFIVDQGEDDLYYGFPRFHVPGVKIGKHYHFGEAVDPETMPREPRPDDEEALRAFLSTSMPAANGPVTGLSTCLYTNTPDEEFVVDHHPAYDDVVVACGFSGHGFKFAAVIGEILADLALDGETRHPVGRFTADRF